MADDNTPSSTATTTISGTVSAHDALTQAESSSAVETPSAAPADPPVAATTQPAEMPAEVPSSTTTPDKITPGPVPYDRFADVNRQRKELSEKMKRFESMAHLNDQELTALAGWSRQLQDNPVAAYRMLRQALEADPTYAADLDPMPSPRASVPTTPTPQADPMPEPDLRTDDGTLVYSASQMRVMQDWTARQVQARIRSEFQQQLQPLEQVAQTVQQERAQAQAWTEVSSVLTEFRADPQFSAHEPDIRQMLIEDSRLAQLADSNPRLAIELAYGRIYREKIAPGQMAQAQQSAVDNLRQRAVSGTANPAQPRSLTPPRTIGDARAALASVFAD